MPEHDPTDPAAPAPAPARIGWRAWRAADRLIGWPVLLILTVGLGLSWLVFDIAGRAERQRIDATLALRAEWRARDLEARLRQIEQPLRAVAIFISSRQALDPFGFRRFASEAQAPDLPLRAILWAPLVEAGDRAALEAGALLPGLGALPLLERGDDGIDRPAAARDRHAPVVLAYQAGPAQLSLGLDLLQDALSRAAADRARDSGRAVATLPMRDRADPGGPPFCLLFHPIYRSVGTPTSEAERRADLRGFAVAVLPVVEMLAAAVRDTPPLVETMDVGIATGADAAVLPVARYLPARGLFSTDPADLAAPAGGPGLERGIAPFGLSWRLRFDFPAASLAGQRSAAPLAWLVAGLILTLALAGQAWRERRRIAAVEREVAARGAELARVNAALAQAQKMEALGQLTGGIAHDVNNILAVVIGNLDLAREDLPAGTETASLVEEAMQAAHRGGDLVRSLLAFARRQPLRPRRIGLADTIERLVPMLRRTLGGQIVVEACLDPGLLPVRVDPVQLESALLNLAINARDAMPDGGRLVIAAAHAVIGPDAGPGLRELAPGDYVVVTVSDEGEGIPGERLARVFEPFFTTKQPGAGTGLGLSMVYGLMRQSGGVALIDSEVGRGTVVRLYLPCAAGADAAAPAEGAAPPRGHGERILLVEDRADLRRTTATTLERLGYVVETADGGDAALARIEAGLRVDLLLTDVMMPGRLDGLALARAALAREPGLRLVFCSGYSSAEAAAEIGDRFKAPLLAKPFRTHDLAVAVRATLDRPAPPTPDC